MSSSAPRLFWTLDTSEDGALTKSARSSAKSSASAAAAAAPHAVKLIDSAKGKLLLDEKGVALLRSLPASSPLNLVFIFGNARSGKSYLMNCLSGCPGLFSVVNSSQPCTKGVDISTGVMPYQQLEAHAQRLPIDADEIHLREAAAAPVSTSKSSSKSKRGPPSPPSIGWVDVEGQGAEDNSYDTMLALPLLLTSKVCLFNHKGAPTVSDMLSKLGVLARAAEYIDVGESSEEATTTTDSSDAAAGGSTFASQRAAGGAKKFGHLHVVFRDFSFEGDSASVHQQLLGLENVQPTKSTKATKSLNSGVKSDRDRENDAIKAVQERNDIRNLLHENFESIHIWLLKQPASADQLKSHRELPEEMVDPEFTREVQRLTVTLASQLRTPALFNGSSLNGVKVSTLLQQITTNLNTNGAISVPSVFKAMENETVNRVFKEVMEEMEKRVEKIKKSLPLSRASLNAQLTVSFQQSLDRFDDDLSDCVLVEDRANRRADLVAASARLKEQMLGENQELVIKLIRRVVLDATGVVKTSFDSFCASVIPIDESRVLEQEFHKLKEAHAATVQKSLRDHPDAPSMPEYKYALLESEETMTEYLSFKLVQNEAAVKDEKIVRLQADAIRQQQLLIEQNKRLEEYLDEEKKNTSAMEAELVRLRAARDEEEQRAAAEKAKIDELNRELEMVRKKKKGCVIL